MKSIKKLVLGMLVMALFFTTLSYGQEDGEKEKKEEFKPVYLTVTTAHWNPDPEVDFSDWLETEKEYFEKVTMKNDLIIGSGFYTHFFTADNSEIIFVSVYKSWDDIEKSNKVSSELALEAWPDKEVRKAFFDKQSSYYSKLHSDEIYTSLPFGKKLETDSEEPLIFYVKKSDLSMEGGDPKKFKEFTEKVTNANSHIKGYYTHRHLWGSNGQEFLEAFVLDSLGDLQKMFDENTKLVEETWPDKEKRKEFFKEMNKAFTGKHGDYIYQNVPELAK